MSDHKVEVVKVKDVQKHPNADRLDLVFIEGWQCVVKKGDIAVGDEVIYIPIDSVLPEKLEAYLFPPDSKITLSKHRVKTIKIRGAISQGMIVKQQELYIGGFLPDSSYTIGTDLAGILGIEKYEPPEEKTPQFKSPQVKKKDKNPDFKEYTSINNFKWYPDLFEIGEPVVITEKIHGTNFRCGYVPYHANTWWKKLKQFLGLSPEYEFVFGSHKVQISYKKDYNGFYARNVYLEAVKKYDLEYVLRRGEVLYGEIYGSGIQKGYDYGCADGVRKLVVFDVQKDGLYMNTDDVFEFCDRTGLEHVPVEYIGSYPGSEVVKETWVDGPSRLCVEQKVREGVVIKPLIEQHCYAGRKILKYKSDEFLLTAEDNTH